MSTIVHPPLTVRERRCLEALVAVHQEMGLFATVTSPALTELTGEPFAGSLATLTQYGLVKRERGEAGGISYRMTERGWAVFAGVDPALAHPEA